MQTKSKIDTAYKKRLSQLLKNKFGDTDLGIILLIEYLKYMRDCTIISDVDIYENAAIKYRLASLMTAVAELESYLSGGENPQFHLDSSLTIIKQNLTDWIKDNDTV